MRVLATSDLHYSTHYEEAVEAFAREVVADAPDVLIVAGDVGEGLGRFRRCLDLFAPLRAVKLVIPGNHDVWVHDQDGGLSSLDLLDRALPQAAADAGFVWLNGRSFTCGGTAFVGSLAWYDWSAADPTATEAEILEHKRRVWVDAWRVDWPHSDKEMARKLGDDLVAEIERCAADRIVVVTHMPVFGSGRPIPPQFRLTAAFFANLSLGERLLPYAKVTHVVSGHVHRGVERRIERPGGAPPIEYRVIPSDYGRPAAVRLDLPGVR